MKNKLPPLRPGPFVDPRVKPPRHVILSNSFGISKHEEGYHNDEEGGKVRNKLFEWMENQHITKADIYTYGYWRGFKVAAVINIGIVVFIWICWRMFQ